MLWFLRPPFSSASDDKETGIPAGETRVATTPDGLSHVRGEVQAGGLWELRQVSAYVGLLDQCGQHGNDCDRPTEYSNNDPHAQAVPRSEMAVGAGGARDGMFLTTVRADRCRNRHWRSAEAALRQIRAR